MFITRTRMTAVATATLAAGALFAAGCGSDDSGSMPGMDHGSSSIAAATTSAPATRTDFNDADLMFLQMMYPHHAQAVEMAKLVPGRTQNQQLLSLAADVEKAQAPEMEQFTILLQSFGKPAPSASGGHTMPGTSAMPGMMTAEQMAALEAASGADFDRQWMQMMIDHHNGAIAMADTELASGVNPDAKALATAINTAQQAEIATMRGMLGQG
ncbi:DUF305 domain-containing protein [Nocardia australiensis]|uniref:DUF305 domain-containing protein n=1 Tax=Nocardia australiensis TaxID=2887191 RepID=UPI001D1455DF|nr:DUF305 domain-containing protein [Nocardia australiensis]